jgi:hypothetical protein
MVASAIRDDIGTQTRRDSQTDSGRIPFPGLDAIGFAVIGDPADGTDGLTTRETAIVEAIFAEVNTPYGSALLVIIDCAIIAEARSSEPIDADNMCQHCGDRKLPGCRYANAG